MIMKRSLYLPQTNKTWTISIEDYHTYTVTNGGKPREKEHADQETAIAYAQKEVWTRLKKGMIYVNADAVAGEPKLHRYTSRGYTGSMPITNWRETDSCCYSYIEGQFEREMILSITADGEQQKIYAIEDSDMSYEIVAVPELNMLFLNRSHTIVSMDLDTGECKKRTQPGPNYSSTLAVAQSHAVWADGQNLIVYELEQGKIYKSFPITVEMYNNHTPLLCATLSIDGSKLAYCTDSSVINVIDLETEQQMIIQKPVASLTDQLAFSADNTTLFALEQYAAWSAYAYDLQGADGANVIWELSEAKSIAYDAKRNWIALHKYGQIEIYDASSFQLVISFPLEHIVKQCSLVFTGSSLAVYTDYGCVSMYQL